MKMKTVLSVLLFLALTGPSTALFLRAFIYEKQYLNWTEAQTHCRKYYEDLVTIEGDTELYRFQERFSTFPSCWIGLSRNSTTLKFTQWSDGSRFRVSNWSSGEPSSDHDKNCVSANYAQWVSENCANRQPFICYDWWPKMIVVQEMGNWEEALQYCRTNYTDLVMFNKRLDYFAVNSQISEILTPSFWTSLRFLDGSWFWVNNYLIHKVMLENQNSMPSCPAERFRCGSRNTTSNVLKNRDCDEKMNFICYW